MAAMTVASAQQSDVAIIGLGVIGGSVALKLRERGTAMRGYTANPADGALAEAAGLTVTRSLDDAVREAGLVLIAVPLDHICAVATEVLGAAPPTATILHAGSLQRSEALDAMPEVVARLIGTHPLAGSHRSGFSAARSDLFREATVFVEQRANARQKEDAELFWSLAGARRIEYATAHEHDASMAWISHLPQLASTALASAMATDMPRGVAAMPGPGGRDATRLAMSNLEMWQPILRRAPVETTQALSVLEESIRSVRTALESRDWGALEAIWERGSAWRNELEPRSAE
ncbi:MAG: prephenate dehydrogenase [Gemmatimonadaceae bacterium]